MFLFARLGSLRALSGLLLAATFAMTGCQTAVSPVNEGGTLAPGASSIRIPSPNVWGGQVRCSSSDCKMALVEHENNAVVVYAIKGRVATELARITVAYHPDFAIWISDELVVAAVEGSSGIEVFKLSGNQLVRQVHVPVGFSPRDVVLVKQLEHSKLLVATPYSGSEVAWVNLPADLSQPTEVTMQKWCPWPWHPRTGISSGGAEQSVLMVGCLDSREVFSIKGPSQAPVLVSRFEHVPRMVVPSPTGRWWYVALELGGRNARIDSATGELQWLAAPSWGAVSIVPISDDLVAWGDDRRIFIQRYASDGTVQETRQLPATGFPTELQFMDVDLDGVPDLTVYNSVGTHVDVHFGPIWERATPVLQASASKQK